MLVLPWAPLAEAQPKKMPRIGYLSPLSGPSQTLEVFKEGLRELGWVEGKQMEFEYRYARGDVDKLSDFATELVRLKVDVIVAGPAFVAARAAKHATTTIPVVMVAVADPVGTGLVASLARPGANVTGLTPEVTREQAGKNLELLKEAVPKVSRVTILRGPDASTQIPYSKEAESAARILGVTGERGGVAFDFFRFTRQVEHSETFGPTAALRHHVNENIDVDEDNQSVNLRAMISRKRVLSSATGFSGWIPTRASRSGSIGTLGQRFDRSRPVSVRRRIASSRSFCSSNKCSCRSSARSVAISSSFTVLSNSSSCSGVFAMIGQIIDGGVSQGQASELIET